MKKTILSLCIFSSLLFSGCQGETENTASVDSAHTPEALSVITSFYPLEFFTTEIVGKNANVLNLAGDQSPHSYKISPQDRVKLAKADLVIYQGLGLESWTEDIIPELTKKNIATVEASHGLSLLETEKDAHDEHEDEEHEEYEEHDDEHEDEHDHGKFDPHTWLDPVLAQEIAKQIAKNLIALDPKNTKEYEQNLAVLLQKLQTLDAEYVSALANCTQSEALVSHNAFGYLQARYAFTLHPIAGLSPTDEPSAKLIADLKKEVEQEGITHVLTEQNNIQAYAQMIAAETGLQMEPINPMGTTPVEGDYFSVSRSNLSALSSAFGCQ